MRYLHGWPLLLLATAALLPRDTQAPEPAHVVEKVVCVKAPAQSYALYLPSRYSRERAWPILYAFDAGARGLVPVERYREAAERYGYILVGSNNSRNGPMTIADEALRAVLADTFARFAIDARRVYFTGFSGGARVAVRAALAMRDGAAGVIGSGAGFPIGLQPAGSIPFAYFGTAGTDDFNYPEMRELNEKLGQLGIPHRLEVFDGGHDWPPSPVCTRAIEWMEIEAMRSKRRPRDEALIDQILSRARDEAEAAERGGRALEAYRLQSALAATCAGLRDVTRHEQKARELAASREVRSALAEESRSISRQNAEQERLARLAHEVMQGDDRAAALLELLRAVDELRERSDRPRNDAGRMAARRVVVSFWIHLREETSGDLEAGNLADAAARLNLMARLRPGEPSVDYRLARVHARSGRKAAAIGALRSAVRKGLTDAAAIESEPDFMPLRAEPAFQELLGALKKDLPKR